MAGIKSATIGGRKYQIGSKAFNKVQAAGGVATDFTNVAKGELPGFILAQTGKNGVNFTPEEVKAHTSYSRGGVNVTEDAFSRYSNHNNLTSSSLSDAGSVNVPATNYVDYSGGLSSALAGAKPTVNADGTPTQYDPKTGLPVAPTSTEDQSAQIFEKYMKSIEDNKEPNLTDLYAKEEKNAGVQNLRQEVGNYQAQLNAITAKAQAEQLSVTGQGRGIPEAIIGGQQSQIAKEAAIKALPIAAQLAAAQGNLALAEDHLQTRFSLLSKDAQNKYERKNKLIDAVYRFASEGEKSRLEELKLKNRQEYAEGQDFRDMQNKLLLSATTQSAPRAIINAITSATTAQDAIAAAGIYGRNIEGDSGGSGGALTILDVARYQELYPDAGVEAGDTKAEADAKIKKFNAPQSIDSGELEGLISGAKTDGNSYNEVVDTINSNDAITDKAAAIEIAKRVYGQSGSSGPTGAANFVNQLSGFLFRLPS